MRESDTCAEMRSMCAYCGGTGDVVRTDGEWLGNCDCEFSAWSRNPYKVENETAVDVSLNGGNNESK